MFSKTFDTNSFFAGGAGMFIQYHDIIKPAYFYAISKMILNHYAFGLPIQILDGFSIRSLLEWYINRRYINPLQQLDYNHNTDPLQLNQLLYNFMNNDPSIYSMASSLSIMKLFEVYRIQRMTFPVFIYSEEEEIGIEKDINILFNGIDHKYVYGDLKEAIKQTNENFTYIFSNIETAKMASEILIGTCSNILISRDYRYNYKSNLIHFKYDLNEMARLHPFERIETIIAMDFTNMEGAFGNLTK